MEDIYIQNKGITKTFIHNNGKNSINEMDWNANYDGNIANIQMEINNNGKTNNFDFQFDNNDLEEMLSIPSVNETLDKRLKNDFIKKKKSEKPLFIVVEDEDPLYKIKLMQPKPRLGYKKYKKPSFKKYTHISSPKFEEEFLVPTNKKHVTTKRRMYKVPKRYSRRTI
jgi:hypothetical protein